MGEVKGEWEGEEERREREGDPTQSCHLKRVDDCCAAGWLPGADQPWKLGGDPAPATFSYFSLPCYSSLLVLPSLCWDLVPRDHDS